MRNRIAVFGDACVDVFVYGGCSRLCPEAPVPVLVPTTIESNDGMALNVARNIESLGICCFPITNDKNLITKRRFVESSINQMLLRVDEETHIDPLKVEEIPSEAFECCCGVVSDYNKGFVTEECASTISRRFSMSFLDTKKVLGDWANHFTFIKINETEYKRTFHTLTSELKEKLIVTLGERGCMFRNRIYEPPSTTSTVNVCGAGDTFLAGFVAEFVRSKDIDNAIRNGLFCASDVVQSKGVVVPFAWRQTK